MNQEKIVKKVSKTNPRLQELENQLKRVGADFDNYRKRVNEENQSISSLSRAQALLALTPVLDNFRRATNHLPAELKDNNWVTGVLYIEKQLEQIMTDFGLIRIPTIGQKFDPSVHEAVGYEPTPTIEANCITTEIESGYTLNGRLLKPAKVKVSSGPIPKNE